MFLSVASSCCHPDGFAIVLKDSWERRLTLSLTETVQFGKQWITRAPRRWVNWKESVSITSSSLCLYSSTHAFLNASLQNGSLFIAFAVFQGWQGGRGSDRREGKELLIETWRHSLRQAIYRPSDGILQVLCRDGGLLSHKNKTFHFKVKLFAIFVILVHLE